MTPQISKLPLPLSVAALDDLHFGLLFEQEQNIVWANRHFCAMFGVIPSAVVGNPLRLFFQSDETYAQISGGVAPSDIALRRQDGSTLWCRVCRNGADPGNADAGYIWSFTDISDQVIQQLQARQEAEHLTKALAIEKALIAKVQVGLLIAKNRLVAWGNQCFFDMVGYSREELVGQSVDTYFANPEDFDRLGRDGYPLLAAGKSYATELVLKCHNGHLIQCVITGNAINPDNLDEGFIWSFADISDLLKAQAGEREAVEREHLEIEKMAALGVVVAGVAHEINTPIGVGYTLVTHFKTKTREFTELFNSGAMKRSDLQSYVALSTEMSDQLATNISRAAELIQSFKQIAVDQSSDDQRKFHLNSYLQEIVTSLMPSLRKTAHQVKLDCPDDISMNSFPGALSQVITNLIMNALVHAFDSDDTGVMTISVQCKDQEILLNFSDDGKGIPAEYLPKIFDPFFTTKRGSGGSGLGLNIVFNLITRKLLGRITCHSIVGEGTVFQIEMPLAIEASG